MDLDLFTLISSILPLSGNPGKNSDHFEFGLSSVLPPILLCTDFVMHLRHLFQMDTDLFAGFSWLLDQQVNQTKGQLRVVSACSSKCCYKGDFEQAMEKAWTCRGRGETGPLNMVCNGTFLFLYGFTGYCYSHWCEEILQAMVFGAISFSKGANCSNHPFFFV
ncbi:hypothetical protein DM860_007307 [Cuscuta australis]|uniref:Uncharacterized protein n=1 Tax=Cuscuta australis TaxID=267555 RepID=A0A328E4M1_9ASTE|nr:hypothetical protein DM860_007307 [Cuscuta australis]